jgi:sugar phosphate isomerase/epimerase
LKKGKQSEVAGTHPDNCPGEMVKNRLSKFLDNVIHTHIHDLSPGGETHWPLTESVVPLADFVLSLKEKNYAGTYNLELRPERWQKVIDAKTGIFESISILKDSL